MLFPFLFLISLHPSDSVIEEVLKIIAHDIFVPSKVHAELQLSMFFLLSACVEMQFICIYVLHFMHFHLFVCAIYVHMTIESYLIMTSYCLLINQRL